MAKLGLQIFVIYGGVMWGLILGGIYQLDLWSLPWGLLAGTALASLVFNFIIKVWILSHFPRNVFAHVSLSVLSLVWATVRTISELTCGGLVSHTAWNTSQPYD
jgi:hypothetical protein